jgi:hypothetical protein
MLKAMFIGYVYLSSMGECLSPSMFVMRVLVHSQSSSRVADSKSGVQSCSTMPISLVGQYRNRQECHGLSNVPSVRCKRAHGEAQATQLVEDMSRCLGEVERRPESGHGHHDARIRMCDGLVGAESQRTTAQLRHLGRSHWEHCQLASAPERSWPPPYLMHFQAKRAGIRPRLQCHAQSCSGGQLTQDWRATSLQAVQTACMVTAKWRHCRAATSHCRSRTSGAGIAVRSGQRPPSRWTVTARTSCKATVESAPRARDA